MRRLPRILLSASLLALGTLRAASAADERRVPLRIDIPKPSSVVYHPQQHMKAKDVEWPAHPDEARLSVPPGTENGGRGMPVACDRDVEPWSGSLDQVTDGEKGGAEGTFVELTPSARWIQIDLRGSTPVFAVMMWHTTSYDRAYGDVVVQLSDDPEFKDGVTTIFNNDADDSLGLGKGADREYVETVNGRLVDAGGVRARYVRLYGNGCRGCGDDKTYWTEVEVHGTPTPAGGAFRDARARAGGTKAQGGTAREGNAKPRK